MSLITEYAICSPYGRAVFKNMYDAVDAYWLLSFHYGGPVDKTSVIKALENKEDFEIPLLAIFPYLQRYVPADNYDVLVK